MILYIANRGEIARRIIRTAKRLGIKTAVGYADQDRDLPFVQEADFSIPLKGEEARDTYIHFDKVIEAAQSLKATHLHPGYGFLSENPAFVEKLRDTGIIFVGPRPESMRLLGDKIGSRNFLKGLQVPLLPSYEGDDQSLATLQKKANEIGYPLLIKPSAGGGGKGMIKVSKAAEFAEALESSKRVAQSAFGDARVFLEKFVHPARHIEVQIVADQFGNVHTIGERECSLQRKHQKLIEESPCLFLNSKLRQTIYDSSRKIAEAAKYSSLGTIEWIWDGAEGIYFLEVNARIQVEHPVTEEVFGIDLVELQIKIALDEEITNLEVKPNGHSIEARLCAEDPSQDFIPSGGRIHRLKLPSGVRCDFGYSEKNIVPSQFDSLLGKLIVHADNRIEAISKLKQALQELVFFGPTTNRDYLLQLLSAQEIETGELSTDYIEKHPYQAPDPKTLIQLQNSIAPSIRIEDEEENLDWYSPWGAIAVAGSQERSDVFSEVFEGKTFFHTPSFDWAISRRKKRMGIGSAETGSHLSAGDSRAVRSPMPAKVNKICVTTGAQVKKGDTLVVLEAMKMEHQVRASMDAVVGEITVREGDRVQADAEMIRWKE